MKILFCMKKKRENEIHIYDNYDTTSYIDRKKKMKLVDLGFELPKETPTKALSLRVPTALLNTIRAYAGENDVSYSAMIKILLVEGMEHKLKQRRGLQH